MNIVVCMKAVPSTTEVKMDQVTNTIIRDGRQSVINPFDASALEEALCIKEQLGGSITVLSMGIPDTVRLLRDTLARGADEGVLLSDRAFAGADTLATSYALSCAIRQIQEEHNAGEHDAQDADHGGVDLILCGKMAVDGDTAQIGPEIAAVLGMPCATDVCEVLEVTEDHIRVRRITDAGQVVSELSLPAVITVTKDIRIPRMPSIAGVRFGQSGPVSVKTAADVDADSARVGLTGSPTQVVRSFTPERSEAGVRIEGTPQEQAAEVARLTEELAR